MNQLEDECYLYSSVSREIRRIMTPLRIGPIEIAITFETYNENIGELVWAALH